MRQMVMGLAIVAAGALAGGSAMACGYAGCEAPASNYNYGGFRGHSEPACGFGAPCAATPWHYGHLPDSAPYYAGAWPRYYYVNQGPHYTGPGLFAPMPTYQERAVGGWAGYGPTAYGADYHYSGGPYGNATTHYYDGMPARGGPRIYSFQRSSLTHPMHRPLKRRAPPERINAMLPRHKIIQVD